MLALIDRKEGELGGKWISASARLRRAEAGRRARTEMATRIQTRTGRRYAVSTLARKASRDELPANVDERWLARWAMIDRNGGMKVLAEKRGRTVKQVAAWRDRKGRRGVRKVGARTAGRELADWLAGEVEVTIGVQTHGNVTANGEQYDRDLSSPRDEEYAWLRADEETAMDIRDAWNDQDTDMLAEILDDLITDQILPLWPNLPPDAFYNITDIEDLIFDEEFDDL
ncbi:hypothetical protein [Mycobacteroides salmoniphilum]|nr:hypothetical protein [Mycobacteroides salmoniphilum]